MKSKKNGKDKEISNALTKISGQLVRYKKEYASYQTQVGQKLHQLNELKKKTLTLASKVKEEIEKEKYLHKIGRTKNGKELFKKNLFCQDLVESIENLLTKFEHGA